MMSFRYTIGQALFGAGSRQTVQAKDSWTGSDVILKSGDLDSTLREARCLLSLPAGVSPRVVELIWKGAGDLSLVLERIPGSTLRDASPEILPDRIPALAHDLAQLLVHVHRVGWIHADIKPDNIMILRGEHGIRARLIDFGFAIDLYGGAAMEERGGTPPYIAPEVRKGWIVDGRADIYSLGIVLRDLLSAADRDPRWAPIIDRACQEAPARRQASAAELRDEICATFGILSGPERYPSFGVGALRGRHQAIEAVRATVDGKSCILVQARPGVGLSRFLNETVLAVAAAGGPPVRAIDLGASCNRDGIDRVLEFLETSDGCPMSMICGIGDPSPGLQWTPEATRGRLSRILQSSGCRPYLLPPLDHESAREMVISALGANSPLAAQIASTLMEKTEADLVRAGEGFARCVETAGVEQGSRWKLDPERAQEALTAWAPPPPPPALGAIGQPIAGALRICARAGRTFPAAIGGALLERFGEGSTVATLIDHGYLIAPGTDRTEFVTQELWRQASRPGLEDSGTVDRWILDHHLPTIDQTADVIQVCLIAHRLGNLEREASLLSKALARAHDQHRLGDVLRLLAYPEPPPMAWTLESAMERVVNLRTLLGPAWSEDALLAIAGQAIRSVNVPLGLEICERTATSADPTAAVPALRLLAERAAELIDHPRYVPYITSLKKWEENPGGPPPGCVAYIEALRANAAGDSKEMSRLGHIAFDKLRGSGDIYESLSAQMLAVIQFEDSPEEGIATMRTALESAKSLDMEARCRNNLAIMYDRMGLVHLGLETTDLGIRRCQGSTSPSRIANLRAQRCMELTRLDRVDQAREEILALLSIPSNRLLPTRLLTLRTELAFCHQHRGEERPALRSSVQAITEARSTGAPVHLFWNGIADLTDLLVDLDRRDLVLEHLLPLREQPPVDMESVRIDAARVEALCAHVEGREEDAERTLAAELPLVRKRRRQPSQVQFLHQFGQLHLAMGRSKGDFAWIDRARRDFEEAISTLPSIGFGYYRARSLLALGRARAAMRDRAGAFEALDQSIDVAREIKSRRLLALGLDARARLEIESL
jgi:hypothetical protein